MDYFYNTSSVYEQAIFAQDHHESKRQSNFESLKTNIVVRCTQLVISAASKGYSEVRYKAREEAGKYLLKPNEKTLILELVKDFCLKQGLTYVDLEDAEAYVYMVFEKKPKEDFSDPLSSVLELESGDALKVPVSLTKST